MLGLRVECSNANEKERFQRSAGRVVSGRRQKTERCDERAGTLMLWMPALG